MTAGIVHAIALLVGVPVFGVLVVAVADARNKRRRDSELCCCLHTNAAHQHYRVGDECGQCACPGFLGAVRVARSRPFTPVGPTR